MYLCMHTDTNIYYMIPRLCFEYFQPTSVVTYFVSGSLFSSFSLSQNETKLSKYFKLFLTFYLSILYFMVSVSYFIISKFSYVFNECIEINLIKNIVILLNLSLMLSSLSYFNHFIFINKYVI